MSGPRTDSVPGDAGGRLRSVPRPGQTTVTLHIPAVAELWMLSRMVAGALASRLDFSFEELEDLRLAIDELCTLCAVGSSSDATLGLIFTVDADTIRVDCEVSPVGVGNGGRTAASIDGIEPHLSERILDALVDDHGVEVFPPGARRGWMTKQRGRAAGL
jgi:serine/threonine-protein kinase RsbW